MACLCVAVPAGRGVGPRPNLTPLPRMLPAPGRDGCHHCGTRKGIVIGDHMPPNKAVQDSMTAVPRFLQHLRGNRLVREVADGLGLHLGHIPQRYYPQVGVAKWLG